MPPKKRPYVPKTKGCYPCSRRRIHCDRTEPSCRKCDSKGLKCTGLGLRLRFISGTAFDGQASDAFLQVDNGPVQVEHVTELNDLGPQLLNESTFNEVAEPLSHTGHDEAEANLVGFSNHDTVTQFEEVDASYSTGDGDSLFLSMNWTLDQCLFNTLTLSTSPPHHLNHVPLWEELLSGYFSQYIASEMIAIDGSHNGWRSLVLPFSQGDALVMQAVVSVSTFHVYLNRESDSRLYARDLAGFGSSQDQHSVNPNVAFKKVILGLQRLNDLSTYSMDRIESVLITILVLLVGVMVNGRSDFPIILRMLESAITAIGGEENLGGGPVADFIRFQARKFRAYSAPLLSEEQGKQLVSSPGLASQLFACLIHRLPPLLECSLTVSFIGDLIQQALNIYLDQVQAGPCLLEDPSANHNAVTRVQHFKETLEAFPPNHPGEQVLIWASFVAASGCVLEEHKLFFEGVFLRHYERNGFANILAGLAQLRRIWSRAPTERWTTLLANSEILVM